MGRKTISFGIEDDAMRRLDSVARRRNVSRGKLIELVVENWLDRHGSDDIDVSPPAPERPAPVSNGHYHPCNLFYVGNWKDGRPLSVCTSPDLCAPLAEASSG